MGADTGEQVDLALSSIGTWNKRRICISGLLSLVVWTTVCYNVMSVTFTNEFVPHHCAVNTTAMLPLELRDNKLQISQCMKYVNTTSNVTVYCGSEGWTYDWPPGDYTIVNEFDLVCADNYGAEISVFCFYAGNLVSTLFANRLADKFGRKWTHILSEILLCIMGLALAFSPGIKVFSALKFFIGILTELSSAAGFVLVCEMFPTNERSFVGTFTMLNWCVAWAILTGMAYQWRNWRHLQLTLCLPFILVIGFIWILPESVPWLVANSREPEAVKILKKMATEGTDMSDINNLLEDADEQEVMMELPAKSVNRGDDIKKVKDVASKSVASKPRPIQRTSVRLDSMVDRMRTMSVILMEQKGKHAYHWSEMFKSKIICIHQLIIGFAWFGNQLVYLCLSLLSVTLAGNKYTNFLLSGMVEIPAYIATAFVLTKYGRRVPLAVTMIICGLLMIVVPFVPSEVNGRSLEALIVVLFLIAKMFITFSFGAIFVYVLELYPTNLRNAGYGLGSLYGKIGGLLVPVVLFLSKIELWLPGLLCGLIALVSGLSLYLLPETHNRPLAVTIEDVEVMSRFISKKGKIKRLQHKLPTHDA